MGDRGNVVIRSNWPDDLGSKEAVFLYAHWGGHGLPEILREALASPEGRGRWDDEAYLARIIFDRIVGEDQGDETGYGISTRLTDNEYPLIVLRGKRIYRLPESLYENKGFEALDECDSISFEDYVALDQRDWETLTQTHVEVD